MKRQDLLKTGLKVAISFGILLVLVLNMDRDVFLKALQSISWVQILMFLGGYLLLQFVCAIKWWLLARAMKIEAGVDVFYRFYLQGMFFGLFLPTAVGGDVGRAFLLSRETGSPWTKAFLSILSERTTGLCGLLTMIILSLIFVNPGDIGGYVGLMVAGIMLTALLFLFAFKWIDRHRWGHRFIRKFVLKNHDDHLQLADIWPSPLVMLVAILLSLVFHGGGILLYVLMLKILGAEVPYLMMASIYGLSGLASMVPLSLNGIGLREGAMTYLLAQWASVPQSLAATFSLVWLSVLLLGALPGALILLKQQIITSSHKKV